MIALKPFSKTDQNYQIEADLQLKKTNDSFLISVEFQFSKELSSQIKWVCLNENTKKLARKDEIWKTTCVEFFFQPKNYKSYLEFNLNDHGDWNLYCFQNYREPTTPIWFEKAQILNFNLQNEKDSLCADLSIDLNSTQFKNFYQQNHFQIGLTAITELKNGEKIYWAIEHINEKPDFHQEKSFQLIRTL